MGASTPRWRVVPSVTLGTGGLNSSVLRGNACSVLRGITGVIDTAFYVNQTRQTIPFTLNIPSSVQPEIAFS